MKRFNPILLTDSYKFSHYMQYPPGTKKAFSYVESRGGKFEKTVMFGLQYILKEYLSIPITMEDVDDAEKKIQSHIVPGKTAPFPFNRAGFERIVQVHNGYWPVRIRALPEGTISPTGTPLVTIENTDPELPWVTSYLETILLQVWYPITVATTSYNIKQSIKEYMEETCDDLSGLPFKLHDFGYRGCSSNESAAIGGAAHLLSFQGTDTMIATEFLREYYKAEMAGFSIPATEHSTITSWKRENEFAAYEHMVNVYKDSPLFACVSDSYDIFKAIKMWGDLKDRIVSENGQTVVVRPDSGDPIHMSLECVKLLDHEFGSTINTKGYRVLDGCRVIYGDGISGPEVIVEILDQLKQNGYSAENIAFGMGGGLLQKVDRDTQKFAMKCSAVTMESGEVVPVYKDPVTDRGKTSKPGRLDVAKGKVVCLNPDQTNHENSDMRTVYLNGIISNDNLEMIRRRLDNNK